MKELKAALKTNQKQQGILFQRKQDAYDASIQNIIELDNIYQSYIIDNDLLKNITLSFRITVYTFENNRKYASLEFDYSKNKAWKALAKVIKEYTPPSRILIDGAEITNHTYLNDKIFRFDFKDRKDIPPFLKKYSIKLDSSIDDAIKEIENAKQDFEKLKEFLDPTANP